ncbi:MAG: DUF975 family protein [Lachnospiraceae bacterium]|nr:DUF975 family protein [Lachnospiraceae bacterium]
MKFAEDFRREARGALESNWGKAVGTGFVAGLLGAGIHGWSASSGSNGGSTGSDVTLEQLVSGTADPEQAALILAVLGGMAIIGIIISLVHLIIGSPVTLGYCKFNLNLIDCNGKAKFSDLFSQFNRLGPAVALQLLRAIYTALWSLLFVIPGIIKGYSYSMAAYILYEHPELTPNEAITKSRELMDGNKWRLFCLRFSFIGWAFLCVFTCGIGVLWLAPYEEAAIAAFYREIWREKYGEPEVVREAGDFPVKEEVIVEPSSYEAMVQETDEN